MKPKTKNAFKFAKEAHKYQSRKDKVTPYITHPLKVRDILKKVTKDPTVLNAALLHDVIEDTAYTYQDLRKEFGKRIADLVNEVTKDEKGAFTIKTKEGLMIKLADILHNISDNNDKAYLNKKIKFVERYSNEQKKTRKH